MRQFRAKEDFFSPETRSQYVAGLTYTIKDPLPVSGKDDPNAVINILRANLATLAERWEREGKIAFVQPGDADKPSAKIRGTGHVGGK